MTNVSDAGFTRLATAALAQWGDGQRALRLIKRRENAVFEVRAADGAPAVLRIHRRGSQPRPWRNGAPGRTRRG